MEGPDAVAGAAVDHGRVDDLSRSARDVHLWRSEPPKESH